KKNAFDPAQVAALAKVAEASAKFLRRAQLARATRDDTGRPFVIKGLSQGWLEVERRIEQVSPTSVPVLVTGESGTGKDLVSRALEQGEVSPLGSNEAPQRVDVRLICATNRDLATMVREGRFRDDLFYRVSVTTIELPALRSYKDNLEILAQVFLQQAAAKHERKVASISKEAIALLHGYEFPGNVRELKNAL